MSLKLKPTSKMNKILFMLANAHLHDKFSKEKKIFQLNI